MVEKQSFMRAEDVAKELEVSVSHAYKIMRKLNELFVDLVLYHLNGEDDFDEEIRQGLEQKLDLKNRLSSFASQYPKECKLIDDDEQGCKTFEVKKGRFGFKLTPPYTEERRKAASELAKNHTKNLRRNGNENPIV